MTTDYTQGLPNVIRFSTHLRSVCRSNDFEKTLKAIEALLELSKATTIPERPRLGDALLRPGSVTPVTLALSGQALALSTVGSSSKVCTPSCYEFGVGWIVSHRYLLIV